MAILPDMIGLTVKDMGRALAFYRLLGLEIPDGQEGIQALARLGMAREFARCQFRHSKPILAMGAGVGLLEATGLPLALPDGSADPGLVFGEGGRAQEALETFATAIARHRHWERETDPAAV